MYFKRIEMQGFKSFADPVSIELNDGVTCIIGPNGSGKSNISDALRWVLGEQSSRQLRGSKMQDVIFAGTATRRPKGMAEVTLVIDNSTGILPLEYSEVAVTRRMFRSGESEYLINGNQCRLRDIRELFMDTGIGVEGYSIIGQGKIADIVSTRPENRRQIFEEAAGVVLYKSRKSEAESKLRAATIDLDRARDIIAEIEGRIDGLREDSEKASEYLELRDKYRMLSINLILHNLSSLESSVTEGKSELESLQNELDDAEARMEQLDEELKMNRDAESALSEEYSDANAELLAVVDELNTISSGGRLNMEKLANIERELERLASETETAREKLSNESAELERLEENDRALNSEMDSIRAELDAAVKTSEEHSSRHSKLGSEIENLRERMIQLNNQNVSRKAEINTLGNYKQTLEDRRGSLREEYEGHDSAGYENRANLERLKHEIEESEAELEAEKIKAADINDELASLAVSIREINEKTDELSVLSNRAIARRSTIEEMEANYEGYNNTVRMLMSRSMRGITGTVSDIIEVPDGLETAVETALGGALQHIVCDDDDAARAAINWLKSARAGRATFLPVESIRPDRIHLNGRVRSASGFRGIASDMVGCDDRYRDIVDYLLCRVVIAETMEDAIAMSKMETGGFRIVTLEGEVVNAFGAITGGRFANRTANLLDRKKEISALTETIDGYARESEELARRRESGLARQEVLHDDLEDIRSRLTELEIACNVLRTDRDHAEEAVNNDIGAAERYKNEIDIIASDIERADKMIDDYRAKIEAAENEYREAEETAGRLMDEAESLMPVIGEDNEKIVALRVRIGENESRVLARNEMIERVRDRVTELEASIEDHDESRAELLSTKAHLTESSADSSDREKALRQSKEQLEKRIQELAAERENKRKGSEALLQEQKTGRESLERMRDSRYKLEVKTARNETLFDTQKDKLWDEFEVSYAEALDMRDPDFAVTAGNRESRAIRLRLAELGDVNVGAIEEYRSVSKRYEFMTAQEADITRAMAELNEIIVNMDRTMRIRFKENFDKVVVNFEQSFKELFGGGYAELRLEDENKPLESGIEITAQPPGKKLKNINLLSGGEKTLTAIALMFAVLKAKPTPFVILDEVEAALDEVNIERFSDYLKNFRDIQFALITHQKATMERADVLYGVTMPEQGISRMLSLRLGDEFDAEGLE